VRGPDGWNQTGGGASSSLILRMRGKGEAQEEVHFMPSQPLTPSAPGAFFAALEQDDLSTHLHRQLIGYVAFLFSWILLFIAWWRSTTELPGNACAVES